MDEKKYGGEEFGSTLAQLKNMVPLAATVEGVSFEGDLRKIGAILELAGAAGELIAEIEELQAHAERWCFGLTVNTDEEFRSALDPFMGWAEDLDPQSAEDHNAFADKAIQTARDNGLWPWLGVPAKQVAP